MDKRPNSTDRAAAIRAAALTPKTFAEMYKDFGSAHGIDDALLIHALTAERVQSGRAPYSEQSAADVIRIYRETIRFAEISNSDKGSDENLEPENDPEPRAIIAANVGDFVQWVSNGVVQVSEPRRVRAVSDDGDWVFVEGSETGIAMSELEVLEPPKQRRAAPTLPLQENEPTVYDRVDPREKDRMKVVWEGPLIHISATVDKAGLDRLRKKLDAMEMLLSDD